jgi:hypothetical protein
VRKMPKSMGTKISILMNRSFMSLVPLVKD